MPSVSIAMATYNGAKHIRRQLESLAQQTHLPSKLIITDDGSTDDTLPIVAEYAKTALFPVHIHKNSERLGYRANFMKAAGLCSSDLIAFCDQDDEWYPQKLERCIASFAKDDVLLVHHNADLVRSGVKIGMIDSFAPRNEFSLPFETRPLSWAPGFALVFRRSLIDYSPYWPTSRDHNWPDEPMGHDQWFYFLASVFGVIAYIDEPLVAYRQHDTNVFGHEEREAPNEWQHLFTSPRERLGHPVPYFQNRSSILRQIRRDLFDNEKELADLGASYYSKLADVHKFRCQIYNSPRVHSRAMAFLDLMLWGGYKSNWFGRKSMLKDALIGLPFGHILK